MVFREIFFHLSSSSYDDKLFSRFERIIFKLFRLRPQLANRPREKRFVGRLWSSFVFLIVFPEYRREHPVGCSHLKIPTASSCPIQSTSDITWCLRLANWTLGSAAAWAVCPLNRKLCIHRAHPSNLSSLFRFLFVLLVLPELNHDDSGPIHLHRGILTISDHRYRRQSLSRHFYQLVNKRCIARNAFISFIYGGHNFPSDNLYILCFVHHNFLLCKDFLHISTPQETNFGTATSCNSENHKAGLQKCKNCFPYYWSSVSELCTTDYDKAFFSCWHY